MDEELLRLWATHHNREAADRLIRRHEQALFAFALRLSRSEAEASEVVQETCLRVLQKAAEFQGRSSLRTWIFGIAVNVARSRRFRLQRLRELFRPLEESTEQAMDDAQARKSRHEILAQVDAALAALPRESRVPILLHYYQGFDYEQIGEILGCPSGTVASRLHAARKRLEKQLRRSDVDLAALGSLEALRSAGTAPVPDSLRLALKGLPQKALAPTLAAPVTGVGATIAGSAAAVALLASAYFLNSEALRPGPVSEHVRVFPLIASKAIRAESASLRGDANRSMHPSIACEDRFAREAYRMPPGSERLPSSISGKPQPSLELRVSGVLRDAEIGTLESCGEIVLRAVWPSREHVSASTDENGYYSLEISGLPAGVYEITPKEESLALPRCIVLRESMTVHHDFHALSAGEEERTMLLQSYREDLARALEAIWLEEGKSALSLRVSGGEGAEPQVFAFQKNGERIEPLARVFQPIAGSLLLGPLPVGVVRVEILQPGKGTAVLPDLRVPEREILDVGASLFPAEDFFSVEAVDGLGRPVAGAHVELQAADLWVAEPFVSGVTDSAGRICFEEVPRRVSVRACRPAFPGSATAPCKVYCGQAASGTTLRITID